MIKPKKTLYGLLTVTLLLTSCVKSNDDSVTLSNDTAIIAFSIGTLNRYVTSTSSTGEETVTKTTVKGTDYTFSIDEDNYCIFNADSLPVGTDVKHVTCAVGTMNNGTVYVKSLEDGIFYLFDATDSLDFSVPREFRVYSSDGSANQIYQVKINVHQQEGDQFCWIQCPSYDEIAALEAMKSVMLNDNLYIYGLKNGKTVGYKTTDGSSWTELAEIDDKDAYQNMVVIPEEAIYMIANGSLQKTTDGNTWTELVKDVAVKRLIATSKIELYAFDADNKIMVSWDEGQTWEEDELDESLSWFPTEETAYVCVPLKMTEYSDYILMAGISSAIGDIASVWRKIVEYDIQGLADKWVYMERTDDNQLALPQMKNLVLLSYDDGVLAFGAINNQFSQIYQSRDNGITWKNNKHYILPDKFEGNTGSFTAATDGKNIWLVSGGTGEVWQGHLNKLIWDKKE